MFRRFFGTSQWYVDPGRILTANPEDLICSLPFDGKFAADAFADAISRGVIINALSLSTADFSSAMLNSVNKKFGNFSFNLGAANILGFPGNSKSSGCAGAHFRNLSAGDYIAYNPVLGVELFLDGGGLLTAKITETGAATETTKNTSVVAGAVSRAGNLNFQHAALRWETNNAGTDALALLLDGLAEGAAIAGGTIPVNPANGGQWYFGAKRNDPTAWDHYSAFAVTPDAEAADAWTLVGAGGQAAVAAGVLTITCAAATATSYTKINNVNLQNMNVETKMRLTAADDQNANVDVFDVFDNTNNRRVRVTMSKGVVRVGFTGIFSTAIPIGVNTEDYNVFRLTSFFNAGNYETKLYINGALAFSANNATIAPPGVTSITFGAVSGGANPRVDYEWMSYRGSVAAVVPPLLGSTSGQLDEIVVTRASLVDAIIVQLVNNPVKAVFGKDLYLGITLPPQVPMVAFDSSATFVLPALFFPSDGKTPIEFCSNGATTNGGGQTALVSEDLAFTLVQMDVPAGVFVPTLLSGNKIFKVGLRRLTPIVTATSYYGNFYLTSRGNV